MNKISEYFEESFGIIYNGLFYISLILIITVIAFISGAIYSNYKIDNLIVIQMLPALGITLSALLASTSLMKSIQNTNKIEKKKKEKEEKQFKNKLKIYLSEISYFIEIYVASFKRIRNMNNENRNNVLNHNLKSLQHIKNLIIKDINFLENIKTEEFKLLRNLNLIEIELEALIRNYNDNSIERLNSRVSKIIHEIEEIAKIYDFVLPLEEYKINLNE